MVISKMFRLYVALLINALIAYSNGASSSGASVSMITMSAPEIMQPTTVSNSVQVGKNVSLHNNVDQGTIVVTGPDDVPNIVSLVAASDDKMQDKIPFTFKLVDAVNIKSASLTIKPYTDGDKQIAGIESENCTLTSAQDKCDDIAYPLEHGTARYVINGTWISNSGESGYFNPTQLNLSVGALYAGYQNNKIHRKGRDYSLADSYGVTALTFDASNETLYTLDGYHIFRHNVVSDSEFEPLITLNNLGYQFSLTNISNMVMVGGSDGMLRYLNTTDGKEESSLYTGNSVVSLSMNPGVNNNVFITNQNSQIYMSYIAPDTLKPSLTSMGNLTATDNLQVVASKDGLFATGNPICSEYCGSEIYIWDTNHFRKIETDNSSPFQGRVLITDAFTKYNGWGLYVSGNNGTLYELTHSTPGSSVMHWTSLNNGQPITNKSIVDAVVDANGSIYLASERDGVWKVPYDGAPAFKIKGFDLDSAVNTVALAVPKPAASGYK